MNFIRHRLSLRILPILQIRKNYIQGNPLVWRVPHDCAHLPPPPPICQILQAIGANYNKEVVEELDQLTCDAMRRSRESTTQQGTTTAVQKFLAFLTDLGVPQAALTTQDRSSSN